MQNLLYLQGISFLVLKRISQVKLITLKYFFINLHYMNANTIRLLYKILLNIARIKTDS